MTDDKTGGDMNSFFFKKEDSTNTPPNSSNSTEMISQDNKFNHSEDKVFPDIGEVDNKFVLNKDNVLKSSKGKFYCDNESERKFNSIRIKMASPDVIRSQSYGEVKKIETVNYRTFNPEKDGLFCSKIFGPVKDYECLCGKYKRIKYKGHICERCGVEITKSNVRRSRMGHIDLACPVAHIWYVKSIPSKIGLLLDIMSKDLESVLYCESYIVIESISAPLESGQMISEETCMEMHKKYGDDSFTALMGAEAIQELLKKIDLEKLSKDLRELLKNTNSEFKRKKIVKRLRLTEEFRLSGNRPEWMILTVLPVLPPDLRPLVMIDDYGTFAFAGPNELYRRLINRNNRLKRLNTLCAPEIIKRNEKRMLQEATDALMDNSKRSRALKGSNKRPFKSLSDTFKGKQGRIRQNLLGKRVDYSGRSVIVVGPTLQLNQCGVPKKIALELFKPFVYAKLELYGMVTTIKAAKVMVESEKQEVWDILDEVIKDHPVILNRAPTLHRLSVQAFEPVLIEGKAIQLHPLVCAAFNADFDGDQMAIHIPLSIESQIECYTLMMASNNILSPSNGRPVTVPSKDMILGIYYLTLDPSGEEGNFYNNIFSSPHEIERCVSNGDISLHDRIRYRFKNKDSTFSYNVVETTPGRVIFYSIIPEGRVKFEDVNRLLRKNDIDDLVYKIYDSSSRRELVDFLQNIMSKGFFYAKKSGISFHKSDMEVPEVKWQNIQKAQDEVSELDLNYSEGLITENEKYNKSIEIWLKCIDKTSQSMMSVISSKGRNDTGSVIDHSKMNSIYMMADSGARGSAAQLQQLSCMRGLMSSPTGKIIDRPIISSFTEGLDVFEYFNSTHGARKGLADIALKTANSGYLTRRLVDVAQDFIVLCDDCGTTDGIIIQVSKSQDKLAPSIEEVIVGRFLVKDTYSMKNGNLIAKKNQIINEVIAKKLLQDAHYITIRSVLHCKLLKGTCAKCYGSDLTNKEIINIGEAVGVIAAQSIGEPGTQLTMRVFHTGGIASAKLDKSYIDVSEDGYYKVENLSTVTNRNGFQVIVSKNCSISMTDKLNNLIDNQDIPYGARFHLSLDSNKVKAGDIVATWEIHSVPIIAESKGFVKYNDLVENISLFDSLDDLTGLVNKTVIDCKFGTHNIDLNPNLSVVDEAGKLCKNKKKSDERYFLPIGAALAFADGQEIHAGDIIARIPSKIGKSKDITGGLPRIVELLEARRPADRSIISEISGIVSFEKDSRSKHRVIVSAKEGDIVKEYLVPKGLHVLVNEGDFVERGSSITDGNPDAHDILRIMGMTKLSDYVIAEIQSVYRLQGVFINNKHIEIIVKQMLRKLIIIDSGDSLYLSGELIDKESFYNVNNQLSRDGKKLIIAEPNLQGITKASLDTDSFIASASFQETVRILTDAAVCGAVDDLSGLKENLLTGNLMPAGTGFHVREMTKNNSSNTCV